MNQREALVVAAWHYEPPYSFYDWTADADDLAELLGEGERAGKYFLPLGARRAPGGCGVCRPSKLGSCSLDSGLRRVGFVCRSRPSTSAPSASTSGLVSRR